MSEVIKKPLGRANLENYEQTYRTFTWDQAREAFTFFAGGKKVNIAYEAVDRHVSSGRKNKVALIWQGEEGQVNKYTFLDVMRESNRVANLLKGLGVEKGDRVFLFLPRIPELYFGILGGVKLGAVVGPMFSAFGPDAVRDRVGDSEAKVVITTPELKPRLDAIRRELPALEYIVVIGATELGKGEVSYDELYAEASDRFEPVACDFEDPLYILYTSGTTGKPKGVVHVHNDLIQHYVTGKWVLDLKDDDIYWCTADPGWVTGTVYGLFAPWLNGATQVVFEGRFSAERWYQVIDEHQVTVWYTAPTSLRLLMRAGDEVAAQADLGSLRLIASVGEPLNPEVIRWGLKVYGLPIHDNWWQTETGAQLIANLPALPIKLGSMGKPLPGIEAAIIDAEGKLLPPGTTGLLAIRPGWPAMMRRIWRNLEKYQEYFRIPGWYATGDTAYMDEDGYFFFVGRADDVIVTAGQRVGPFEVESALLEHPAVAEAGVIGKPDPERGEIIKAFVTLVEGQEESDELKEEIRLHVRQVLSAHAYPREIEFKPTLPKTRSGKIMRRVLKAWDLGLPTGDLSGLED